MKRTWKQIGSLFLAVCMVLTMLPTMAFAAEDNAMIGASSQCEHHGHTEDCYNNTLTCEIVQDSGEPAATEGNAAHTHGEACYESTLDCKFVCEECAARQRIGQTRSTYETIPSGITTAAELKTALEATEAATINVTADISGLDSEFGSETITVGADHTLHIVDGVTVSTSGTIDSQLIIPNGKVLTLTGTGTLEINPGTDGYVGINVEGVLNLSNGSKLLISNSKGVGVALSSFTTGGSPSGSLESDGGIITIENSGGTGINGNDITDNAMVLSSGSLTVSNSGDNGYGISGISLTASDSCAITVKNSGSSTGIYAYTNLQSGSTLDIQNTAGDGATGSLAVENSTVTVANTANRGINISLTNALELKDSVMNLQGTGGTGLRVDTNASWSIDNSTVTIAANGGTGFYCVGTLTGANGSKLALAEGAKIGEVDTVFNDQGFVYECSGTATVVSAGNPPSSMTITAGEYVWNGTIFAKGGSTPPSGSIDVATAAELKTELEKIKPATINVTADIDGLGNTITLGANHTLNIAVEKIVSTKGTGQYDYVLQIPENKILTLTGPGTLKSDNASTTGISVLGTLKLEVGSKLMAANSGANSGVGLGINSTPGTLMSNSGHITLQNSGERGNGISDSSLDSEIILNGGTLTVANTGDNSTGMIGVKLTATNGCAIAISSGVGSSIGISATDPATLENSTLTVANTAGNGLYGTLSAKDSTVTVKNTSGVGISIGSGYFLSLTDGSILELESVLGSTGLNLAAYSRMTVDGSTVKLHAGGGVGFSRNVNTLSVTGANDGKFMLVENAMLEEVKGLFRDQGFVCNSGFVLTVGAADGTPSENSLTDGDYVWNGTTFAKDGSTVAINAEMPTITAQPVGATYTQGAAAAALSVTASVSDGGTLSYQWYGSSNSELGGSPISGAAAATFMPSTAAVGTMYYYAIVTNTNNAASGNKMATIYSTQIAVTVQSGGGSDGDDGGGGSYTSPAPSIPANTPADVTKSQATGAAKNAAGAAKASGSSTATVRLKNPGKIAPDALQAMSATAGISVKFQADSMSEDGKVVDVRITLDPAKADKELSLSASTTSPEARATQNLFESFFANDVRPIHLNQTEAWGQPVEIAAKVDLTDMDVTKLVIYSYDKATNTYRRIEKPAYWMDTNGYLHFTTPYAGDIVISEGPLALKEDGGAK